MTKQQAIIFNQMKERYHKAVSDLQDTKVPEDVFEEANISNCTKYITPQGNVRIDIDFDTFQDIFNQSIWNWSILKITSEANLHQMSKKEIINVLYFISKYYSPKEETAKRAEIIRRMSPLFDYRKEPH